METEVISAGPIASPERSRGRRQGPRFFRAGDLVSAALLVPLLATTALHLAREWYRVRLAEFGCLVLIGAAFLAWRRFRGCKPGGEPGAAALVFGSISLAASLSLFLAGWFVCDTPSQALALLLAVPSLLLLLHGPAFAGLALPSCVLIAFALPIPHPIQDRLVDTLRDGLALTTSFALDLTGAANTLDGNVIRFDAAEERIIVAKSCAGLTTIRALVTFGVFLSLAWHRRLSHRLVSVATALALALVANAVRVYLIGALTFHVSFETGELFHDHGWIVVIVPATLVLVVIINAVRAREEHRCRDELSA